MKSKKFFTKNKNICRPKNSLCYKSKKIDCSDKMVLNVSLDIPGLSMTGGSIFWSHPEPFKQKYRCYSVSCLPGKGREEMEKGGKVIMAPSALDTLTRLHIQYPMLFKLSNEKGNRITHCGVLEFIADEGRIYIPYWMMRNLLLDQGDIVTVDNIALPVAAFAKFQPHHVDFLDITSPKAVLENALRDFACLTVGDVVAIMYNNKTYELSVLETKPADAVSIIECDMSVDFAAPIGYQESVQKRKEEEMKTSEQESMDDEDIIEIPDDDKFKIFGGVGQRLDGKAGKTKSSDSTQVKTKFPAQRGVPNYDYSPGTLQFLRNSHRQEDNKGDGADTPNFIAFGGSGNKLKPKQK